MNKICVTGANGFIGNSICNKLINSGRFVRGFVRTSKDIRKEYISVGDMRLDLNWEELLNGFDCIIHCAGMAHKMDKKYKLQDYLLANTKSTKYIAQKAANAGVKKFIFLSTIKVNGEKTYQNNNERLTDNKFKKIFKYSDNEVPEDFYAVSKYEAEKEIKKISARTGLEVVIIRLPLVYGRGVKGNLSRLIKLISYGLPLPFALINNRRSMIGIDNLIDFVVHCIDNHNASGKTFLISDDKDLSTPDLIKQTASVMGCKAKLFPFPVSLLKFFGYILGRKSEIERITGSLQVDSSYARKILNWSPPISVEEGIRRMIKENDKGF
ncbi:NAD-dependent epimerase/dehydratase family protein [Candidatus Pelagibacter sp. HIMB1709]|uniref:NAD-dependent epimerase/dehydratase family protein n=1 Tax=Candidatus Pelagibacter sp. HIMB1709 TaxID=3413367 RepID=UPI003F843582